MWASDLALKALRQQGENFTALRWADTQPTQCGHCGKPIETGDPYAPVNVGVFFSDTRNLAAPTGVACGGCLMLRTKKAMNGLSFTVITEDGVYPIAKDVHKAWLFLTPPPAPFVAVHSSSTMQHLVWRTPVTLDNRLIYLRYGPELFTLRPDAIKRAMAISLAVQQRRIDAQERTAPASIFVTDRKLRSGDHGQLNKIALKYLQPDELDTILALTPGEIWALGFLLTKTAPQPEAPAALSIEL